MKGEGKNGSGESGQAGLGREIGYCVWAWVDLGIGFGPNSN